MGFGKLPIFLALSFLAMYHVCVFQAAPIRDNMENCTDADILNEEETRVLLTVLLNAFVQIKVREAEKELDKENSDINTQDTSCDSATCMTQENGSEKQND